MAGIFGNALIHPDSFPGGLQCSLPPWGEARILPRCQECRVQRWECWRPSVSGSPPRPLPRVPRSPGVLIQQPSSSAGATVHRWREYRVPKGLAALGPALGQQHLWGQVAGEDLLCMPTLHWDSRDAGRQGHQPLSRGLLHRLELDVPRPAWCPCFLIACLCFPICKSEVLMVLPHWPPGVGVLGRGG